MGISEEMGRGKGGGGWVGEMEISGKWGFLGDRKGRMTIGYGGENWIRGVAT